MAEAMSDLPPIGLGTWPALGSECVDMVASALTLGYRLIDTAQNYDNEAAVAEGIRQSGVPRDEIWVASKLNGKYHDAQAAVRVVEESLLRMRLDYLDLFLIHWPNPQRGRYLDAWCRLP